MMMALHESIQQVVTSQKRVLVVGLGVGGLASARALRQQGAEVVIAERRTREGFFRGTHSIAEIETLEKEGISIVFGVDGERLAPYLSGAGLVVMSPGVSLESSAVGAVTRVGIPFISDLELAVGLHSGRTILVAGSNGKSTTAALIHHTLQDAGLHSFLSTDGSVALSRGDTGAGAGRANNSTLIVEATSFQLEVSTSLKPNISVILNSSEGHLERHGSLERYALAMEGALRFQRGEDLAVLNADDPIVVAMATKSRSSVAFFGESVPDDRAREGEIVARISRGQEGAFLLTLSLNGVCEEYSLVGTRLIGAHNRYNIAAAVIVARRIGIPQESVQRALRTFMPLEHRLEVVVRDHSRAIINDSKSTTVASTLAAFSTITEDFQHRPIVLMIGGLSKAGSWSPLLSKIKTRSEEVASVICFGKDGSLLASHCRAAGVRHITAPNLGEATREALRMVSSGGTVLLSPGCSSFDEFADYQERGAFFKRYVREEAGELASSAL